MRVAIEERKTPQALQSAEQAVAPQQEAPKAMS